MNSKNKIGLRLQLSDPTRENYGCLENCIAKNCKGDMQMINEIESFQAALGYMEEIKNAGLLFDEFIFEEYKKANATQSPEILQEKIIQYLRECCSKFEEVYLALDGIQPSQAG